MLHEESPVINNIKAIKKRQVLIAIEVESPRPRMKKLIYKVFWPLIARIFTSNDSTTQCSQTKHLHGTVPATGKLPYKTDAEFIRSQKTQLIYTKQNGYRFNRYELSIVRLSSNDCFDVHCYRLRLRIQECTFRQKTLKAKTSCTTVFSLVTKGRNESVFK